MYLECSSTDARAFACFRSTGVPAGPSAASGSNRRLQQTQNQVDEVLLWKAEKMNFQSTWEHSGNNYLGGVSQKCERKVNSDHIIKVTQFRTCYSGSRDLSRSQILLLPACFPETNAPPWGHSSQNCLIMYIFHINKKKKKEKKRNAL